VSVRYRNRARTDGGHDHPATVARDPGCQAERTALSWTRTSLALLANGLLLTARELIATPGQWDLISVSTVVGAVTAAAATYFIGRARQRVLSSVPLPKQMSAPRTIVATCCTTVVLSVLILGGALR